ncbi:sigma 54-interacting transcriptional regulator [Desulfobacterales bacterium HSG2]|nr:sigma 54-interacting transcriptional regulator [Desulfobacterales bacterium HSG2]
MTKNTLNPLDQIDADFLTILSAFDEGIIIADIDGIIVFYNETQAKMDGLDPGDVIGKKVTQVYSLNDDTSKIMTCIRSRSPIIGHLFFYQTRAGKVVNTIHSVFPLFRKGRLTGAICFVKDYNILDKTIASTSTLMTDEKPDIGNGTRFTFADITGSDPEFLGCLKNARMAADSPSPIMLFGATGTGKEIFAQSVHNYSSRSKKKFVAVNCAAIPENLLEGILFGTTRGAFTGALDKPGLFEQANGGTLFLDELDSMPLGLQAKLLRVLQEKRVRRIGSPNETAIDLKIISTVNKDPRGSIREGILRVDLFYRLGVVFIRIPPLMDRSDDIDVLTRHFLYKLNFILSKNVKSVSESVAALFHAYHWPGNVRELEHIIEGAMNMIGQEEIIKVRHLPDYFTDAHGIEKSAGISSESTSRSFPVKEPVFPQNDSERLSPPATADVMNQNKSLFDIRTEQEKEFIFQSLTKFKGNISKAARSLGISRQLLHYKMKKFGIDRKAFV